MRSVFEAPPKTMANIDARYDSKSVATRISRMVKLILIKYSTVPEDIARNIDHLGKIMEQYEANGNKLVDWLAINILATLVQNNELATITEATKILAIVNLKREAISTRILVDMNAVKYGTENLKATTETSGSVFLFCFRFSNTLEKSFFKPKNSSDGLNKLS